MNYLTKALLELKDNDYKNFSKKLIPDTKLEIIGVRTPLIKNLAKTAIKAYPNEVERFLKSAHSYYDEALLHGLLLSYERDIDELLLKLDYFVLTIDNWAVCDCTVASLKILKKHPQKTLKWVKKLLNSPAPYAIRFGIIVLLSYFLDENFSQEILPLAQSVISNHYYINTGLAWFYSVALIKQYDTTIKIIESKRLDKFVHNKSIQKAIDSFRISQSTKDYLKTLKI